MTDSNFQKNLEKYAEVIVKVGLNIQPGQQLLIRAPLEAVEITRAVTRIAYQNGSPLVNVLWDDEQLKLIRFQHAPRDSFEEFPSWYSDTIIASVEQGDALLSIHASNPNLLEGQDADLIALAMRTQYKHTRPYQQSLAKNSTPWLVISVPTVDWAAKVLPDIPVDERKTRLWETIFDLCRINQPDPVAAWQNHIHQLAARTEYLNAKQYKKLNYTAPGTGLTIGLPDGHLWVGGHSVSQSGITFVPNIPTEEVFTLPHKDIVEGTISSTRPFSYAGNLIENFTFTFEAGRVIKAVAEKGEETLRRLLETDEGATHLGEVALVPHSSPISRSGLLFNNTLYDENASCHLALGNAYKFCISDGENMTDEDFATAGGNISSAHEDFMVGSGELNIDGITQDGHTEPVMRTGEWAFDIE